MGPLILEKRLDRREKIDGITQRSHKLCRQVSWLCPVITMLLLAAPLPADTPAQAAAPPRSVSGFVTDRSGSRLPRVQIRVYNAEGKSMATAISNNEGAFRLELPVGKYVIAATLAGIGALKDCPLEVTENTPPLTLTLEVPGIAEQIIVTATRTEAPLSQIGSSVTVITGDRLRQESVFSISDALRRVAGLTVVQSGGYGQVSSLFVRGGGSNYTKVLIDGIPMNEPGGSYNFANLSASGIDRIEIVRGPQSALFGSDAIAGVVQIFTRRGSSDGLSPLPSAKVEGGTFATYHYAGGIEGKADRFDYAASFSRLDTDDSVLNGSFNNASVNVNLGFRSGGSTELRAVFHSDAGRSGVPGEWAFYRPDPDEFYRRRDLAGSLVFTHQATTSWGQKLAYTIADSRQLSEDPANSGCFVPEYKGIKAPYTSCDFTFQTLNKVRRQRLTYQSDLSLPGGHLLTFGGDFERETGIIGDPDATPLRAIRDNAGGFIQDQWAVGTRFFSAAGVRIDHNENFGYYATPRLSLAYHLHQPKGGTWGPTKVKASFGLGIKEPSLIESFSQSPYFRGNPALRPEKSAGFDAGIEQYFNRGRGSFEVTWFDNRYRDQIAFITTDYTTFEGTFFNIGKSRARGLECMIRRELGERWEVAGGYTYLDSRILESTSSFDPVYAKGQELLRRPKHSGYLDLRWKPGRWTLGATGIVVGSRVDSDFVGLGLTRNRSYGVLNLSGSFQLSKSISVYSVVNNALDKNYMEVLGYPALRRNFRIGLRAGM